MPEVFEVPSTASVVFVWGPAGMVPLVDVGRLRSGPVWKFPGGCAQDGESPLETAKRKLAAETGLILDRAKVFGHVRKRRIHVLHFFYTVVESFADLKHRGDGGEEVILCSAEELLDPDILIPIHHRQFRLLLKKFGCL